MTSRIPIAIIGAGMASAPHVRSLLELGERVEVRRVVARSIERAAALAQHFPGAVASTSLDDVVSDPQVQAALVLTPPRTHAEIVTRLAAAGKHVLLEKPIDVDADRAGVLVDRCRSAGVRFGVVLQHRMRPASQAAMAFGAAGRWGVLTSAALEIRWWRPQSYYDEPGRGTFARDGGGVLLTQAIHTLDLFLQIAGVPAEVAAFAGTSAAHRMECEDIVAAALRYPNGAVATVNATTAAAPGFEERIQVSGTLGSASLQAGRLEWVGIDGSVQTEGDAPRTLGAGADPMDFPHQAHRLLIEDFLDAIEQGRDPAASGASALPVQRLIDAILESAARRMVVALT